MSERVAARILVGYNGLNVKVYVTDSYAKVFGIENAPALVRTALDRYRATHESPEFVIGFPFAFYGIGHRPIERIDIFVPRDEAENSFDAWVMEDGCPVIRDVEPEQSKILLAERRTKFTVPDTRRYLRTWPEIPELDLEENES